MTGRPKTYDGAAIQVIYDPGRCIHAAECVRGLPAVFDPDARPWVKPDGAGADEVARVVARCPTGALQFQRQDDAPGEEAPTANTVTISADGPLYAKGDIEVVDADGNLLLRDRRVAFCRCGQSAYKPFCDGRHAQVGFHASDGMPNPQVKKARPDSGTLKVTVTHNGPLVFEGPVTLRSPVLGDEHQGSKGALCRCGASGNKPFCDGAHVAAGFSDD
jgi:CDGSH-type Zn-finger protein/uncharacterized Fe-S cluster protein YjdI